MATGVAIAMGETTAMEVKRSGEAVARTRHDCLTKVTGSYRARGQICVLWGCRLGQGGLTIPTLEIVHILT